MAVPEDRSCGPGRRDRRQRGLSERPHRTPNFPGSGAVMSLDGKVAVVTGGGRGIGRAVAVVLAAQGAPVAVWDLNAEGADETVAVIQKAGGTAIAVVGDAADSAEVAAAAAR